MEKKERKKKENGLTRILLKFKPQYDVPYQQGGEKEVRDSDFIALWGKLLIEFPGLTLNIVFKIISIDDIHDWVKKGVQTDNTYKPVDFSKYFYVDAVSGNKSDEEILAKFKSSLLFEKVAITQEVFPPDVTIEVPGSQNYLNPAPQGIDAAAAWAVSDGHGNSIGKGGRINFIDIESGWNLMHEGLNTGTVVPLNGAASISTDPGHQEHGTAVLGVVAATGTTPGCVGIAPECHIMTVGLGNAPDSNVLAEQFLSVFPSLSYGDIILLETEFSVLPVESDPLCFDVIRLATALGMVIIEPAGNTCEDLDLHLMPEDSGAIMVGGVDCLYRKRGVDATHYYTDDNGDITSNFGSRVNCYAWYKKILTLSNGPTPTQRTRDNFDGTSGASAIIAGAAICLQGILQFTFGMKYNSRQMRLLLCENGTASACAAIDRVGVMPDLRAIIYGLSSYHNAIVELNDVYIRDNPGDLGDRHQGAISNSPDIITLHGPSLPDHPENFFDDPAVHSIVQLGETNYVYARVFNRGRSTARNVKANVYYADVATLVIPENWIPLGTVNFPDVPPGRVATISDALTWDTSIAPIPAAGHYCYVCIIGNDVDPMPFLPPAWTDPTPPVNLTISWDDFCRLIWDNNNITWKNFNVIDMTTAPTPVILEFRMVGAADREVVFDFNFKSALPANTLVRFEYPDAVAHLLKKDQQHFSEWNTSKTVEFNSLSLPKKFNEVCKLKIRFPENYHPEDYTIAVEQLYEKRIVGKITWKFITKD